MSLAGDFDFGEFGHGGERDCLVRSTKYTYTGRPMSALSRRLVALAATLAATAFLASSVHAQQQSDDDDDEKRRSPQAPAPAPGKPAANLPLQELTGETLFEFLLGEIAAQRGNPALAAQTYLDLAKRTRDPRVARRAVEVANFARMPDVALEAARIWHDADPDSAQALQTVTVLLVGAKRVDEAEPYLAKLLATDGNAAANGFLQLGRLLAANPDTAANLRVVRKLAEPYPNLAAGAFRDCAGGGGGQRRGARARRSAARVGAAPRLGIAALYEAQLLQRSSPGEAAKRLADYLEKYPDARDVRLNYARLLVLDKRYRGCTRRIRVDPEAFPERRRRGLRRRPACLPGSRTTAVAEANMKRLLDLGYRDANAVRYTLGQIAEEQKDWARAIEWYKTIQRGENALPARMRIANAIAKQGKLDEARAYLHGVAATNEPQRVQLLVAESQLLREANQHREAFDLLGEALKKTPDQPDLLYDLALTAEKLDRFDVLESSLKRLIQVKPDYAHAYNALGYSFADRNVRLPEAKQLIEKALEISPEDFFIVDSLGWVLYRMGDLKNAAVQLRRAWDGRPDGEIGAHLGEVLWELGQRDEARRIWQEAQKASPESDTLQKTLKRFSP